MEDGKIFGCIFLKLIFEDSRSKVEKMNKALVASKTTIQLFTDTEFYIGFLILIGVAVFSNGDCDLFVVKGNGHTFMYR